MALFGNKKKDPFTLEDMMSVLKPMSKTILHVTGEYKDGGSRTFVGGQQRYWEDQRIGSTTKGVLFVGHYGDTSTKAKGEFVLPPKTRTTRKGKTFTQ